jgi:hypothetical protein
MTIHAAGLDAGRFLSFATRSDALRVPRTTTLGARNRS